MKPELTGNLSPAPRRMAVEHSGFSTLLAVISLSNIYLITVLGTVAVGKHAGIFLRKLSLLSGLQ